MEWLKKSPTSYDLQNLRAEMIPSIIMFSGALGYVWTWSNIWPITGRNAPLSSWIGGCLLLGSALASSRCRKELVTFRIYLLMAGICAAVICALLTFNTGGIAYLTIVPIVFASVLFGQIGFLTTATLGGGLVLLNLNAAAPIPLPVSERSLALAILMLVIIAAWLSARNLHTSLLWFSSAYKTAYQNEQAIRERQAELRRLLRILDETTHHLEQTNLRLKFERNQAESARRMKQQLAQTISHELRTPLNIIAGFADIMAQNTDFYGEPLPAAYMRDLSIIYKNAQHVQKLVNDVLDLSRVEAAQMTLLPQATHPDELVRDVVETIRSLIEVQNLAFHCEVEPHLPLLWIDPTRIRQVLFNLLNNAVRFTEAGSVTLRVYRQDEDVVFAVKDTGIGIAPEDTARIFEEFQQVDGTTRRRYEGAGLGLAISQRFVSLHNGAIWVKSQVGEGSIFAFSLPIVPEGQNAHAAEADRHRTAPPPDDEKLLLAITANPTAALIFSQMRVPSRAIIVDDLDRADHVASTMLPKWIIVDRACTSLSPEKLRLLVQRWSLPDTTIIDCLLPGNRLSWSPKSFDGYLMKPVTRERLAEVLRPFANSIEKILIVDEDRDVARLVSRMLEQGNRNYRIMTAHSTQEGLALIQYHQPDLVLLSLEFNDIPLATLLERFRASERHLLIVALSDEEVLLDDEAALQQISMTHSRPLSSVEHYQWVQRILSAAL